MTEITPDTPFEQFKKKFTPLYRTLLILGVLAILSSLITLTNLRPVFGYFPTDPLYAISATLSSLIVPVLMLASLFLLWHKHIAGLRIRFIGYGVSIIASILGLFTSTDTISHMTREVVDTTLQNSNGIITSEIAAQITEASFFSSLYLSIGVSMLFAWLWWKAWKRQIKVDAKKK